MERVLKQLLPAAGTLDTLYTVGANSSLVTITSFIICNQMNSPTVFSIKIIPFASGAESDANYIFRSVDLAAKETRIIPLSNPLAKGDIIKVSSGNGSTSFSLFGMANTPNNP